jgi:hypothetical protein
MQSQNGTVGVPYSKVPLAAQQGYGFADDATRFRFNKDAAADPNRGQSMFVSGMSPQQSQARANAIEQNDSLPLQLVGGAAKGAGTLARPFLDVTAYAMGAKPQEVDQMLTPQTKAQANAKAGTEGAALIASAPLVAAAPLAAAGGVLGGTVGAGAGQVIGNATHMSPGATNVLSDTLGLAGGAVGATGARPLMNALDFSAQKQAAGSLLSSVANDANKVPVELENSQDAALRLMDWQKKTNLGPTINKFLNRITDPKQGPLTYADARDYYQLLGKLSVEENNNLAPTIQRSLGQLVAGLKQDIGNAADTVGKAADYYQGMGDFAAAAKHQEWFDAAKNWLIENAAKTALKGAGLGAGYGLYKRLSE